MADALVLEGVHKSYGKRVALAGLNLRIPQGSISGLVGPNGAGKTTSFGIVGGLLRADAGRVDVLGQGPYEPDRQRGLLGLLPQDSEITPHGRVAVQLTYLARLQGLSAKEAAHDVSRVLELVALSDRRDARVGELSHGMRRRVAVAQALLGAPKLVLLDEPTSGLDPHLVKHMRDVIVETNKKRRTTFVVSSHVLADLEAICDHVSFIESGRTMQSGKLSQIVGAARQIEVEVLRMPSPEALRELLGGLSFERDEGKIRVEVPANEEVAAVNARLLRALLDLDAGVLEVRSTRTLEQSYLSHRQAWQESENTRSS